MRGRGRQSYTRRAPGMVRCLLLDSLPGRSEKTRDLPKVTELIPAKSPSKFLGSRGLGIGLFKIDIVFPCKEC